MKGNGTLAGAGIFAEGVREGALCVLYPRSLPYREFIN